MHIVNIAYITISENRQRKTFDENKIAELAQSILSRKGLMHPIVVRQINDEKYELVAGERRFRAIQSIQILQDTFVCNEQIIPPGFVPVTFLQNLSPLEIMEAELEENTLRVDLSMQEQALAVAKLHELRELQKGKQTVTATAEEIFGDSANKHSITKVGEQILVAKHLDNPEVAKAKTLKEAIKVIEKQKLAEHRQELAKTFDLTKTSHRLIHDSAFEAVKTLESNFFDLIVTDPPYGVDADTFGDMAKTGHNYKDDIEYARDCYTLVAREGFRVTKDKASVYAFCDIRYFYDWTKLFAEYGWTVWQRPLIWNKKNGMLPMPDFGPRNTYEAILFAFKPGTKLVQLGQPDVIECRNSGAIEHGAQKPVELYVNLMKRSANPAAQVLDLFAGSGTILPAANTCNMYATAVEMIEANYNLALSRINDNINSDNVAESDTPYDLKDILGV